MNVFSFDLAVDGRDFDASAHKCHAPSTDEGIYVRWRQNLDRPFIQICSRAVQETYSSLSKVDKKHSHTSSNHVHSRGSIDAPRPHYWCNGAKELGYRRIRQGGTGIIQ